MTTKFCAEELSQSMSAAAIIDWKTIFKQIYDDSHKKINGKFNKIVEIGVLFFQKITMLAKSTLNDMLAM